MKIRIGDRRLTLHDRDLIGRGGEALVYRAGDRALKIFFAPCPDKFRKLEAFPAQLPPEVLRPLERIDDSAGTPIGYAMALVAGGRELRNLGEANDPSGRWDYDARLALFGRLHALLRALHQRGLAVGDLNDGNVLFTDDGRVWLIDVDSFQIPPHGCTVAHPSFLDPRLYGRDLSLAFDPTHDWYAFSVLLFQALLGLHPYGGVTPRWPTLLRRAEAGHSALQSDVRRPKNSVDPETLPPALRAWFERIFDGGARDLFPEGLLRPSYARCGGCGLEHGRSRCPACAKPVPPPPVARGRCRVERIFATRGQILQTEARFGRIAYLYLEDGVLRREDGARVPVPVEPGARFALAGSTTWVGRGPLLEAYRDGRRTEVTRSETFAGRTAFAAQGDALCRIENHTLVSHPSGLRIGRALDGQTELWLGPKFGFGAYRAGRLLENFVYRLDRAGQFRVDLPELIGRVWSLRVDFDAHDPLALLTIEHEQRGAPRVLFVLIDARGRRIAAAEGDPNREPLFAARSKVLEGGRIVAASDQGLLAIRVNPAAGTLTEAHRFAETETMVSARSELQLGPAGSIYVIEPREIVKLSFLSGAHPEPAVSAPAQAR